MSRFLVAAIGSGSILAIVPATDPGRRRATTWRLVRLLLAVVIVCGVFVHSLPLHGNDRPARLAGVGLGVLCGLVAGQFLPVSRDGGEIVTRGGSLAGGDRHSGLRPVHVSLSGYGYVPAGR